LLILRKRLVKFIISTNLIK